METNEQIAQLERKLAISAAISDIELICRAEQHHGHDKRWWFNTSIDEQENPDAEIEKDIIADAIKYLDALGLIAWHPEQKHLLRIRKKARQ